MSDGEGDEDTERETEMEKVKREISTERRQVMDQPDLRFLHSEDSDLDFSLSSWLFCCLSGVSSSETADSRL